MEPKLVQSIASPIRLFASSHVTLGPYGTALFIDSHTEDYFGHGDHGQRLAGEILSHGPTDSTEETDYHVPSGMASVIFGVRENDIWNRVAMDEEAGRIAVGSIDGTVRLFDFAPTVSDGGVP